MPATALRFLLSSAPRTPPPPPMYITLYYLVTRLPDSLRSVKDHFLSVCPTTLTVDLLEERLLAAEKSIVAVGASCCDPRSPFFEGPPPPFCPLLPLVLPSTSLAPSRSALHLPLAGDAALARARGARALEGLAGAVEVAVEAAKGVGVAVGVVAGVGASVAAVEEEAVAAVAVGAEEEAVAAAVEVAAAAVERVGVALHSGAASVVVSASSSSALVRPRPPSSFVSGTLRISGVGVLVLVPTSCVPATALLFRPGVAIFDLDYDATLAAMFVVSTSDEGDCYLCVPPDPGIAVAALGAGEAAALGASASAAPGAGESAVLGAGEFALSGTTTAQA
ncbi:unnamed protein product [Closterium sp. NIES-65]|nr:unnamed protein product [Closterium sp. NIES-65]